MRADRLISLLMLLQTRGRMTTRELAAALEVSERTIYRDVNALSVAGIPIYGEPGRRAAMRCSTVIARISRACPKARCARCLCSASRRRWPIWA